MTTDLIIGSPRRIAASTLGGDPPDWLLVFPDGIYRCTHGDYYVGAEERQRIIATWRDYGNNLAWDWEHEAFFRQQAGQLFTGRIPTSAYYTDFQDRGAHSEAKCPALGNGHFDHRCGLWGRTQFTESGLADLKRGDSIYDSPLFDVEPALKKGELPRVVAIWGCTLTSSPASKGRVPIVMQTKVAACRRIAASRRTTTTRIGGSMGWPLTEDLRWAWDLPRTTTNKQLRESLLKVVETLPDDDNFAFATAASRQGGGDTLGSVIEAIHTEAATAAGGTASSVASRAVLEALGITDAAPTEVRVIARVLELETASASDDTLRSDLVAARARIVQLEARDVETQISAHIAANRNRLPPAREKKFRELAASKGLAFAKEAASFWPIAKPGAPDVTLEQEPVNAPSTKTRAAATARVGGIEYEASSESHEKVLEVERYMEAHPDIKDFTVAASRLESEKIAAARR